MWKISLLQTFSHFHITNRSFLTDKTFRLPYFTTVWTPSYSWTACSTLNNLRPSPSSSSRSLSFRASTTSWLFRFLTSYLEPNSPHILIVSYSWGLTDDYDTPCIPMSIHIRKWLFCYNICYSKVYRYQ